MRKFSSYLMICIKGIGMGAANVIPGVSGGTIAFLTGIYKELIDSIRAVDLKALKLLFTGKTRQFWEKINGNFLLSVLIGIIISLFSLAKLMTYFMKYYPVQLWSFFFGLIIASAIIILKDIKFSKISNIISLVIGFAIGAAICLLSPAETPETWWFILICGAVAMCTMILPGISGSFMLLLLGKYQYMLDALTDLNIPLLLLFTAGAVIGIVSFSHLLSWLFKKYYNITICILSGIMTGSLLKVWPWQIVLDSGVSRPSLPFNDALILSEKTGHVPEAIIFAFIGMAIVIILEILSKKLSRKAE